MSALTLVKSNTPHEESNDDSKYSEIERETIQHYQAALEAGRYFKLYNAASPYPRLISGDSAFEPLPLSFLADDFVSWCRENRRRVPNPRPSPEYLAWPLETVTGVRFVPRGPALVRAKGSRHKYVNTFRVFDHEHEPLPLSEDFLELLEAMFPADEERHTFVQYCAHIFQQPEVRPSWHPMLLSATGTGKGFLMESVLTPLLREQTRVLKKYTELTGRFSNAMEGTLLVLLDDCKSRRDDVQTQLKSLMSEERVLVEQKHQAAGMVHTYTRFILASNEEVPLDLDDTDRRWWVPKRLDYSNGLTGDDGRKDRKALIQRVAKWLIQDGALESVHKYLMEYSLTGFDPKTPPMTATLREQIAKSVTVEQSFSADFLAQHETKVVKLPELCQAFTDARMNRPGNFEIGQLFANCGYKQEMLSGPEGKKSRWWIPLSMSKADAERILSIPAEF
jgi:hypothetical protein